MPQGVQHRVVLVGVDDSLQSALKLALQRRAAEPAALCPDLPAARTEALAHSTDVHLFIVQLAPGADPARLGLLTSVLPGQPVLVMLPQGADLPAMVAAQRRRRPGGVIALAGRRFPAGAGLHRRAVRPSTAGGPHHRRLWRQRRFRGDDAGA